MNNLETDLKNAQKEVNKTIKSLLPIGKGIEKKLFEAIHYSILSTGKSRASAISLAVIA